MRGLRARRHRRVVPFPWARGAVADREDVRVPGGLQRRKHDELVDPVRLEPVEILQEVGRLDARRPHDELRRDDASAGELHALRQHLRHARRGVHEHAEPAQELGRGLRQALRQRRQDAIGSLDHVDLDVLLRVDAVEAVGDELARRLVQLGGELDPGRAGADDRHVQLFGPQRLGLGMRPDAGVHEPAVKAPRLVRLVEPQRMLRDARRAEVIGLAADRDDQRVVGDAAGRRDLVSFLVDVGCDVHLAPRAIEPDHLAHAIAEVVPVRLREVVELVHREVHAARRDLVQQRLPQVRARLVDQCNVRLRALAQRVAEPGGELEPARAAADHDDAMRTASWRCRVAHRADVTRADSSVVFAPSTARFGPDMTERPATTPFSTILAARLRAATSSKAALQRRLRRRSRASAARPCRALARCRSGSRRSRRPPTTR